MDIQKHHEESLASLPEDIVARGVASIVTLFEEHPEVRAEIRREWNEDPETWWAPFHHGWGTAMRNYLRDHVCRDEELPSKNWDDYYIPLLEVAAGVRKAVPWNPSSTRERLADYAHSSWSGWMKYLFSKSIVTVFGFAIVPEWAVERWTRQMNTPYAQLPEKEKDSDRAEADKILAIFARE